MPVDRLAWSTFLAGFDWRQGEHISLVGPTGCGKTTLGLAILDRRRYVIALGTKPRDETLDELRRSGWTRALDWPVPPPRGNEPRRIILWPRFDRMDDAARQRAIFDRALRGAFIQGGWCLYADELRYLAVDLQLAKLLRLVWLQGRSLRISLVGGTQRPAWVPLEMYDQATHLFLWRDNDESNLKRISGIGGALNAKDVRRLVSNLPLHDVLYLNTRTGAQIVTRVGETAQQRKA